jgi:hypothetical protein
MTQRLTLTDVILRNNSARVAGGGLFNNGDATLTNVTVFGDSASVGGGIANQGTLALTHVSIRRDFARFARGLFNSGTMRLLSRRLPGRSAGGDASPHGDLIRGDRRRLGDPHAGSSPPAHPGRGKEISRS